MSNVFLTSALLTPTNAAAPASAVPGTIADPPPAALQLASGSFVRGEVIGRSERGQVLVRTDLGTLAVATRAQLPTGSQVTLQIRSSGSQLHIAVLQVDGHAPQIKTPPTATPPTATPPTVTSPGAAPPGATQAAHAPPPTLPAPPAAGVPATVANPPPATGLLAPGAVLQGVVLGANDTGQVLIRTDAGTLPLATTATLPSGSQVTLQVQSLVPQLNVLIAPGTAPASAGQAAGTVDVLALGQTIRAHVQGPQAAPGPSQTPGQTLGQTLGQTPGRTPGAPAAAPAAAQGPHLHPGGTLQLTVLQVTPPGTAAGPQTTGTAATLVSSAGPQAGAAASAGHASAGHAPGMPSGPQTTGGVSITGFVTGTTAAGQPQVQTGFGALTLDIKANLPPGTRLVLALPASAFDIAAAPPPPAGDPKSLAYRWPALDYALESLRSLDAPEAQGLLSQQGPAPALPQAGPRLTSSLLFFLTALTGGNPGGWVNGLMGGQAARLLERAGQGDLLARLGGELTQMARLSDAAGNDWRLLPMPFFDGHHVQQLRLFLRRDSGGGASGGESEEATRFVLEVSLTRLGDLQLDGLVRGKRFDLILRTRDGLPDAMRGDILQIFQDANDTAGYKGALTFQASRDWSFIPLETADTEHAGLVV